MWTPLLAVREEGWQHPETPLPPPAEERHLGRPIAGMAPRDWMILGKLYENKSVKLIAKELGLSAARIHQITATPAFKDALATVEGAIVERIARGEFGVMAIFKAESIGAARRIVGMGKAAEDERVRLHANVEIIKQSGFRPPAPAVTESPERLIDQMTAAEADHFSTTGEFPERFADQLARLASSVLAASERKRWEPQIDAVLLPHEDPMQAPVRTPPREVEDGSVE
jgi:hypothetical protein